MFINLKKSIAVILIMVVSFQLSFGQPQSNKPNGSTIPSVGSVYTPGSYLGGVKVNYIRTWDAMGPYQSPTDMINAGYTHTSQTTQYQDGLGRPFQQVARQVTPGPSPKDIVLPVKYDAFGREQYKFLTYAANASSGAFRMDPFGEQKAYLEAEYSSPAEKVFYSKTNYEASPLNRVDVNMAPGNAWGGNNKGTQMKYFVNTAPEAVRCWNINNAPLTYVNDDVGTNIPFSTTYEAAELTKTVIIDENDMATVEYKDKNDQLVFKKVQVDNIAADYSGIMGFLCTYYVYDVMGRLRFIIPPKAVDAIKNTWTLSGQNDVINELCVRYEYDNSHRLIAKKSPGAGWTYMVYDTRDRLVFTQDANFRKDNRWATTLYDALNRPAITGIMTYSSSPSGLQATVTSQTTSPVVPSGLPNGLLLSQPTSGTHQALYSITLAPGFETVTGTEFTAQIVSEDPITYIEGAAFNKNPLPAGSNFIPLTYTYYDNYAWTSKNYTASYNNLLDAGNNPHPVALPQQASQQISGFVTGTKTRIINDPANLAAGGWLTSVNFFDDKGRIIQVRSDNHRNGEDIVTNRYSFNGKVLCSYLVHNNQDAGASGILKIKTSFEYDHAGRLLKTWKTINDEDAKKLLVSSREYDELGQVRKKELGQRRDPATANYITGTYIEKLEYNYNVRGWLKGINKDFVNNLPTSNDRYFGMELNYDWGFEIPQYNGNVAGVKWKSKGDGERRSYGFTYDNASRLLGGDFGQHDGSGYSNNNVMNFDMQMGDGQTAYSAYDENGNIKGMRHWGVKLNQGVPIDDLTYAYINDGNRLRIVSDGITANNQLGDFTDKNINGDDYDYDGNGNMVKDLNRNIAGNTGIIYNHLNLPWKIDVMKDDKTTFRGKVTYVYNALGVKFQKIIRDESTAGKVITTTTDYIGGMVYESKTTESSQPAGPSDNYQHKLQFVAHEEGRIRYVQNAVPASFVYDFFIKDNLGNVRMVLTDEIQQDPYPAATLEGNRTAGALSMINFEKQFYAIQDVYIKETSGIPGWNDAPSKDYQNNNGNPPPNNNYPQGYTANSTATSQYMYQLNATANKTGLGIVLKVMAGDKIDIHGKSYYEGTQTYNNSNSTLLALTDILGAFIGVPDNAGISTKGITSGIMENLNTGLIPGTFMRGNNGESASVPKAYINYIFFDEQFKYVGGNFSRAGTSGIVKDHWYEDPQLQSIAVPKNGYLYVYVSNESNKNVYFDNLQVFHTRGPILEETHYYPFGLTMDAISSKAALGGRPRNNYKFNGAELNEELDLGQYDFFNRTYNPQLGRWNGLDIKPNDQFSPYSSMLNNPLLINDPLGDTTYRFNWQGIYIGAFDLDVKGTMGAIGTYSKYTDAEGKIVENWRPDKFFSFNDPTGGVDRDQLNNMQPGQKGLTIVSDENVNWIMNTSNIHNMGLFARWDFAFYESAGGRMDFNLNYTLPSQGIDPDGDVKAVDGTGGFMLMGSNLVAYNLNDAGQFIWGYAMKKLGFSYSSAKFGSQSFARGFESEWDAEADQKAIREGFHYTTQANVATQGSFKVPDWDPFRRRPRRDRRDRRNR